jgi:uncharacterized membrane protein YobD (UPF0266 family)
MKSAVKFEIFVGLITNSGNKVSEALIQSTKELCSSKLDGITLTFGLGVWNKTEEPAMVITHIGDESETSQVIEVAKIIRINLNQDAVLIAATEIKTLLIEAFNKNIQTGSIPAGIGSN